MMLRLTCSALVLTACFGLFPVQAGTLTTKVEKFSAIANGEDVGHVWVTRNGNTVDIDYHIDENGRGPKHHETLQLGKDGVPLRWSIDGTSLMGGAVHEDMQWADGVQRWTSQADHGAEKRAAPELYIANDTNPWALALYATAALRAPGHSLDVLPTGRITVEKIRSLTFGTGKNTVKVNAYILSGIDMTPDVILLDPQGHLFATVSPDLVVRKGYEGEAAKLVALGEDLSLERLQRLQQQTAHTYSGPIRIRNVHVFDPVAMQIGPLSSVVVYRDRITTVEPANAPAVTDGETIIDGQGGTLVTGMHDMHAHVSAWDGPLLIAGGVTTVRDLGNNNVNLQAMIRSIDHGDLIGPHIIPSGFIEGRSPYSARDGIVIATLDEGLRAVRWYADHGYNQIKIYNSMNPAFVAPLAAEAHRLGLRVVGHVPAFATPDQMIESGYNEITHVNQLILGWLLKPGEDTRTPLRLTALSRAADLDLNSVPVQHTLDLMRQHNVSWDTTISIVEQLMMSRAGEVPANAAAYIDHLPIGAQRYKKRSYVNFKDEAQKQTYDKAFHKVLDTMALFHHAGIKLLPGTDAANGFTLHRELELYMQAGMSAAEALRMATYDCDAYLGRDQNFGTIARGKQADFFLVPGDPSKDLSQLHKIRMVVKGGTIYYPSEIYQAYGIVPFAPPPPVVAAPVISGDVK